MVAEINQNAKYTFGLTVTNILSVPKDPLCQAVDLFPPTREHIQALIQQRYVNRVRTGFYFDGVAVV